MAHDITLKLANEAATLRMARWLSHGITGGVTLYLHGDLGAGKTTLVRGLLHHLGYVGKVKSPTYTLVEPYVVSGLSLYHFDLYRFIDPEEWDAAGFREYFNAQSVSFVEWPEKAGGLLPTADIDIHMQHDGKGRKITMDANTTAGKQCLARCARF